jgi:glutamate formiminotransferase
MRLLTVPNWSFGQDSALVDEFRTLLDQSDVFVHYVGSDPDHNRTVTAFSGTPRDVEGALVALCSVAFDQLDMRVHTGVHPRVGALDVCPFLSLDEGDALAEAESIGAHLADRFELPVFLYEKSERGRHEADLPSLRRGGFEGLKDKVLRPDFGPREVHPSLGVTILGVREFLIAFNVELATENLGAALELSREIRTYRADGDPRFLGVRALGFPLSSRGLTQVSLNMTLPDSTAVDPIVHWLEVRAAEEGVLLAETELIGVIRDRDLLSATELHVEPSQVVSIAAPSPGNS